MEQHIANQRCVRKKNTKKNEPCIEIQCQNALNRRKTKRISTILGDFSERDNSELGLLTIFITNQV